MTVVAGVDVTSPEMPPRVTILAIDERYRHYLYHFRSDGERCSLAAVRVDGHFVRPENKTWSIPVPDPVGDALTRAGASTSSSLADGEATGPLSR